MLDPMHIEGNVSKFITKYILGERDGIRSRQACKEEGVHRSAWIRRDSDGNEYMPPAPWILSDGDRAEFKKRITSIRMPTGMK